ncbi:MAG: hypothetical protein ACI906_003316 [Candidatus Latescibacterota bacterium]|jgi:hypothetical protein
MLLYALCAVLLTAPALCADMNINVPFLPNTPTIDGDLSEWKDSAHNDGLWDMRRIAESSFYTLDRGARNRLTDHGDEPPISDDLSARYYIAWDEQNLYFGAEVHDNINDHEDPAPADKRWYFNDAICWFMEGPRDSANERFGQGDNAFCFVADPKPAPKNAWWRHGSNEQTYIEEPIPTASVDYRVKMNPWGQSEGDFILEARVDLASTFGQSDSRWTPPQTGDEYSMEIVHTDPDGGDYGGHFMIYGNGDDDNTWRRMILVGPRQPLIRMGE